MKNKDFAISVSILITLICLVAIFNYIDNKKYNVTKTKEVSLASNQVVYVENNEEMNIDETTTNEEPKESVSEVTTQVENSDEFKATTDEKENNVIDSIVYDGMTLTELAAKLDRSLHSDLSGTGYYFAKYAIQYNVDPYMVVAISLHETGCNATCSAQVVDCNNVGGQRFKPACYAGGTYGKYDTLELGIEGFIKNIANNYVALGLNTPDLMQAKYVGTGSTSWAPQVNNYIEKIKGA
ncbi:MAG: glucosaminidase domain-containing protein [Bacilli bacterium]|nr:glucosaminidase domain-containing protein [Bacilli bacterium]